MNTVPFITSPDSLIILYLTPNDLDELKRDGEFPYGLRRRKEELAPFVLPDWSPRKETLGARFSTNDARDRYLEIMRRLGRIPSTPVEFRLHLPLLPEEAKEIGAAYDRFQGMFYIPVDRADSAELKAQYCDEDHQEKWRAWRKGIKDHEDGVRWNMAWSNARLLAKIIWPKRGPKPDRDKWWSRMAWAYFQDLSKIGTVDANTTRAELFRLILDELAIWNVRLTADALRKIDGTDWNAELGKLRARTR